jgi:hypothetical protein
MRVEFSGAALPENVGVYHSSSLKMDPKTPNAWCMYTRAPGPLVTILKSIEAKILDLEDRANERSIAFGVGVAVFCYLQPTLWRRTETLLTQPRLSPLTPRAGLNCIVALYHHSSTLYQIH